MKRIAFIAAVLCGLAIAFTSCNKDTEIGTRSQLIGQWKGTTPTSDGVHFVFLDEAAEDGYAWGYQWNEDEDISQSEVLTKDYHGNGWFMWKKNNTYLRMRHMMNASEANAAIDQTLYELTDTHLSFDDAGSRIYLIKYGE